MAMALQHKLEKRFSINSFLAAGAVDRKSFIYGFVAAVLAMAVFHQSMKMAIVNQSSNQILWQVEEEGSLTVHRSSNNIDSNNNYYIDYNSVSSSDAEVNDPQGPRPYGTAAALFVHVATYRGGHDSFAIIGLGAKPAHVYGGATLECTWRPENGPAVNGTVVKYLPDWNMGRQYTVVVANCSFADKIEGAGNLMVRAVAGDGAGVGGSVDFTALEEPRNTKSRGASNTSGAGEDENYDFVYCGSPLFGKLNAARVREWLAYHAKLMGPRTHFVLYDAGGISGSTEVQRVLRRWARLGRVSVRDVRELERFDGYYHNQFLVVNDCLHRWRLRATWMFFFDLDEYLYAEGRGSLADVMAGFASRGFSQVIFTQRPIAPGVCRNDTANFSKSSSSSKWGIEQLVYRNVKEGVLWDRKYALQPTHAFTAGVHRSDNTIGETLGYLPESIVPNLYYYHYHNTINEMGELCQIYATSNSYFINRTKPITGYVSVYDIHNASLQLDTTLQDLAQSIKDFEHQQFKNQAN